MNKHIVVVNTPKYNRETYFTRFITQIRENQLHRKTPVILLNTDYVDGLPIELERIGARHVYGHGNHEHEIEAANLYEAEHILILARDEYDDESDSLSFDLAYRLKEKGLAYRAIVECVDDENRERFRRIGVKSVIRPIRSYPEILVRAMESPGSELIIEDMFTWAGDYFMRYPAWLEGDRWGDVVVAMMTANLGTPLAYVSKEGNVVLHPPADEKVVAQSIIMLVRTEAIPTDAQVREAIRLYVSKQASA